ncbi:calcium-binding protein [Pseudodonghicola flavimaris]|uniref:Calcium-binding protein n=1 Tax=Pseudodonghicola flavimaris TaxID=3050036 RepID=A0ABT7F820_9RHOB|nr:hypothetical protein [Pseudodonghicola flavimaris]MDK3020771.1 hypothetical protein [Pseudodonghicola flavimaris]
MLNGTSTTARTLVDGEEGYVGPSEALATTGTAISGTGNANFTIEGSVYSGTEDAIGIDGTRGLGTIGVDGNDTLYGRFGDDRLDGGDEADTMNGGAGDDTLRGNVVNDAMNGGGGSDTLIFAAGFGHDTVNGFHAGATGDADVIAISSGLIADYADLLNHTADVGANTVITMDASNTITLLGVHKADLDVSDVSFF